MIFKNRTQAAHSLSKKLSQLMKSQETSSVLVAISRGGVVIASELSSTLSLPHDYLVLRPVFAPWDPTIQIGAISETGTRWIPPSWVREGFGDYSDEVEALFEEENLAAQDQALELRKGRPLTEADGLNVVLVDDGSTENTFLKLAQRVFQEKNAARIFFAAPILPADLEEEAKADFSGIAVLEHLPGKVHVSAWYEDFEEVSDAEITELLRASRRSAA